MRKILIMLLVMLCANLVVIYFIYNLVPTTFSSTEPDSKYSLIIDEGDELEVQWQYTTLNHSILENLVNENEINLDMTCYNQDDVIEWTFSIPEDEDSSCGSYYWEVLRDEYKQIGYNKQYISSHKYRIYKKSVLYLNSMFRDDNYYTNRLIPIEVDDFIKSLNFYIHGSEAWLLNHAKNYTLETNSFNTITKLLRNNTNYSETFSYNVDGILNNHVIYYDNQTAMELKLIKYEVYKYELEPPDHPTGNWFLVIRLLNILFIVTIAEIIIVIVLISIVDDSHNKKPPNKEPQEQKNVNNMQVNYRIKGNNQLYTHSRNDSRKPSLKHELCSNCRALLEDKSKFCHNCGKPTKSQGNVCQHCGRLRLKDAKYCIECSHIF